MQNRKWNESMAQIILRNKLATKEQIQSCLPIVTAERDIGKVMVMNGLIKQNHYQQIKNHLLSRMQPDLQDTQPAAPVEATPPSKPPPQAVPVTRPSSPAPDPVRPTPASSGPMSRPSSPATNPSGAAAAAKQPVISGEKSHKEHYTQPADSALPDDFRQTAGRGQLGFAKPETLTPQSRLDEILVYARRSRASDVHLSAHGPIIFRRYGQLVPVTDWNLTPKHLENLISQVLGEKEMKIFSQTGDVEMAYTMPGGGRYRLTVMEQRFGWDFCARVIPYEVRSFEDSGLPENCRVLTTYAQGMVLITGPMGCGKSSTLCTLVDLINSDRQDHIITIENPIEYIFQPQKCQITQREVGMHTLSQGNALKGALRQDPDILVVSELRDVDSMRLAITAAETGHLVLATMNTANATRTIDRLIDSFPPEERDVMRTMVSESLRGVIAQQLVPKKDGTGMVPAYELLLVTQAVSNLIRKSNTHQLESAMISGRGQGMITLDNALEELVSKDLIEGEEAFFRATNPKKFQAFNPDAKGATSYGQN